MTNLFNDTFADAGRSRKWRFAMFLGAILSVVMAVFVATLILTATDRALNRHVAKSDDLTWIVSQVEVDLKNFTISIQDALLAQGSTDMPAALDRVREKFDVFYSRVNTLGPSRVGDVIKSNPDIQANMPDYQAFLDRHVPSIDGDDADLAANLGDLLLDAEELVEGTRVLVLAVVQEILGYAYSDRVELRDMLMRFALGALIMIVALLSILAMGVALVLRQKRQNQIIRRIATNLRATIEASQDAVIVLDEAGHIQEFNPAAERMLGYARADAMSGDLGMFLQDDLGRVGLDDEIKRMLASGSRFARSKRLIRLDVRRSDGSILPVEVGVGLAEGADGDPLLIAFVRDISRRLQREAHLKQARNDALKGEAAKSRFLTVMSHELRTPLNGLLTGLELMRSTTSLDDRQNWLVETAERCGLAALEKVNNVLELTRMTNSDDGASYPAAAFNPREMIENMVRISTPLADQKGTKITFVPRDARDSDRNVVASEHLFSNVVYNFIGNAVKFTEKGKIDVVFDAVAQPDGQTIRYRIEVRDTGPGIASENLDRIFENFETLDGSYSRKVEGTGLGLGIAKRAAKTLGGRINVESVLGHGSTFSVELELPIATAKDAPADLDAEDEEVVSNGRPLSILVAEDNEINRSILREILQAQGHSVTEAVDGLVAVEIAENTRFDVIMMDISMPRMDGVTATRRIRQGGACKDVAIVGVTAHAMPEQCEGFLEAGMDQIVIKPIRLVKLKRVLAMVQENTNETVSVMAENKSEQNLVDMEVIETLVDALGKEIFEGHVQTFMSEHHVAMGEVRDLMQQPDLLTAARVAHKAAGAAAVVGAVSIQGALNQFEFAAKDGDASKANAALADVDVLMPQVEAFYADLSGGIAAQ